MEENKHLHGPEDPAENSCGHEGAAAATSTYMSRNIPMSIVMSIPMTGNAPAPRAQP